MKFVSYLLVAVIAFTAAFLITSNDSGSKSSYDFSKIDSSTEQNQQSTGFSTYYSQLTDFQKVIYNTILPSIRDAKKEVVISNVNAADFKRDCLTVTTAIQYDYPEYFWFTGGYSYKIARATFSEVGKVTFSPIYYDYVSGFFNAKDKYNQLDNAANNIVALAKKHSENTYEQIVFVHDYLIKNAKYDHDGLDEYYKTSHNPSCEYIFSAYGCLVNGKTVCSGYAKAFQIVMRKLGFNCSYVTGDAGEAHGWNCLYLDGEGYYVDITWDDLDLESESPTYNYAFITSSDLYKTHKVEMPFETPVCNETKYNYFVRNGYYDEKYDFATALKILSKQSGKSSAHIRFGSVEELGKAYKDIITNGKMKDIPGISNFAKYYYNEDHYTLSLFRS